MGGSGCVRMAVGDFAGDLPEAEQKVVWATQAVPVPDLFTQKGRRRRVAVQAELVHRGHRRSHRPSRTGALRCEAHGRHDCRVAQQPVPMLSKPDVVIEVIRNAAEAVAAKHPPVSA